MPSVHEGPPGSLRTKGARGGRWSAGAAALALIFLFCVGCKRLVVYYVASSIGKGGQVFAAEDDPELVRESVPFGLKALESLLEGSPENDRLLLSAASGFTQYAYAFVLQDAQMLEGSRPEEAREQMQRARNLFRRAWTYGYRGLEARHSGFNAAFRADRREALGRMRKPDVPLLYWSAAALAAQVSISMDDMAMVGRLPDAEALMARALELDEGYGDGAIHEFYIAYESRPASLGGSAEKARQHYERAMAQTGGARLSLLVVWAEQVMVPQQDRKGFLELLEKVLAFDVDSKPRFRLQNLLAQRRARWLKSRVDDLFLEG